MKASKYFLPLIFLVTLFASCSSEEDTIPETNTVTPKDPPVIFNELGFTKTNSFIEDAIYIDISGENFKEVDIDHINPDITVTKISLTSYSVKASKPTSVRLSVAIKNDTDVKTKSITLNFYEHGVKNFNTIEGIRIDVDRTDKAIELLGEPDAKIDSTTNNNLEYWYYFSKGFILFINKTTNVITQSRIYGYRGWRITINEVEYKGELYPYNIYNEWNFSIRPVIMDDVITKLGTPSTKETPYDSITRAYIYNARRAIFLFFSENIDNYAGKQVLSVDIY